MIRSRSKPGIHSFYSRSHFLHRNSSGFFLLSSDPQPDNSGSYLSSYFHYGQLTKWTETSDDYFTDYGYVNQDWQAVDENYQNNQNYYQGRYEDGDENANGDAGQQQEEEEDLVVYDLDSGYSPYQAFDIGKCDTYSHLWTYDLFVSCSDGTEHCECTYAIELMKRDLLSCSDLSSCPSECGVCSNCLHSVCDQFLPSQIVASAAVNGMSAIVTAAIFGTVLLATCVALKRNSDGGDGDDGKNERLVDETDSSYSSKNLTIVLNDHGLPVEDQTKAKKKRFWKKNTAESKPVWLAPDVSTIPMKPLFPDLLKGSIRPRVPRRQEASKKGVEMAPVGAPTTKDAKNKNDNTSIGPLIVTSSNASVPSSISDGDSSDSSQSGSSDSSSIDEPDDNNQTRPDGKSIGTLEGEI